MKRYESYKPSGISWIGEIPSHWETIKLKNLFLSFSNGTTAEQIKTGETEFPVTRIETISSGKINKNKVGYVQHFPMIEKFLLKSYDILLSHINSYEKIGNFAIVTENDLPIYHGMNLLRLIPREESISNYAKFYFKSIFFIRTMQCFCKPAINQVSVSSSKIKDILMPIPPIDEQKKIVEYLSSKTAKIDALQAERDRELRLLEELKQAEIANVVTRGLNPNVPMKDSGIPWIGQIPAHWATPKFYHLFDFIGGNGFPVHLQGGKSGQYPFYKTSDINGNEIYIDKAANYVSDAEIKNNSFNIIPKGAFLMSKIGAALRKNHRKITTQPCLIDNNLQALIRKKTNKELELYLFYYLKFFNMAWVDNNGTIPCVDNGKLRISIFPIPPIEEQRAIVEYIEQKNKAINDMIANLRAEIDFLTEYKQRLIADAVTGQIKID